MIIIQRYKIVLNVYYILYVTGTIPFIFYNTKIAKQSLKLKIKTCTI